MRLLIDNAPLKISIDVMKRISNSRSHFNNCGHLVTFKNLMYYLNMKYIFEFKVVHLNVSETTMFQRQAATLNQR